MENQTVSRNLKNFKSLKEAFDALPMETKQHCIRVAEYTKALFIEAIAVEMRMDDKKAQEQLEPEHERGAYLAGLYHDIGKVMVPVDYHNMEADFSAEEVALYRKHTQDGVALVRQHAFGEQLSEVEQTMVLEAIEFHHQKPDEGGFPQVKREKDIAVMPLLVGFADYLDHQVNVCYSETPFEDTMKKIMEGFPKPAAETPAEGEAPVVETEQEEVIETELQVVVQETVSRLRRVFVKYQDQSNRIPSIVPFVKRRSTRPFELKYRPIVDRKTHKTVGVQAKMYFKDNKDVYVEFDEVKAIVAKNKLGPEIGRYFLYEAADTYRRIQTCGLPIQYVALELMPTYFSQQKLAAVLQQQLTDMRMEPGQVLLSIDESNFQSATKVLLNNMEKVTAAGIPMMLTGWNDQHLKAEDVKKYAFTKVTLHPEMYPRLQEEEVAAEIQMLLEAGVEILAGDLDKTKYNTVLNNLSINSMTGSMAGDYLTEDELVRGELSLQV